MCINSYFFDVVTSFEAVHRTRSVTSPWYQQHSSVLPIEKPSEKSLLELPVHGVVELTRELIVVSE